MMLQILTFDLRVLRFWAQAKIQPIFTEKYTILDQGELSDKCSQYAWK